MFDMRKKNLKDHYSLLITKKYFFLYYVKNFEGETNLSDDLLTKTVPLPRSVSFERNVKAFQFKVLNPSIILIRNCIR